MRVCRVMQLVDGVLVADPPAKQYFEFKVGDVVGTLTTLQEAPVDPGPAWNLEIILSPNSNPPRIEIPLERFITVHEINGANTTPLFFGSIGVIAAKMAAENRQMTALERMWVFRDGIYIAERVPRPSERDLVSVNIKASHYQRDEMHKRLRELVANVEAIENHVDNGRQRKALPDDVRVLVWTRDGGACVRCGASNDLHFDHIIPFSRGGSDEALNIQILCRACNLAKSDRIA